MRAPEASADDAPTEDQVESSITSAPTEPHDINEDNESFVSPSLTDSKENNPKRKTSGKKSKKTRGDSKFCPETSEVSCDDLVIVLEERRFLKVLEDVVKELVEKLVTEKLSNKGSASSQNQTAHSKLGSKKMDAIKSFDKKIKDVADSQRRGLEAEESGPEIPESGQIEQVNLETESSLTQTSEQTSSKVPSESTQGKSPQSKTKSGKSSASSASAKHRDKSSAAKGTSEAADKAAAESAPMQDHKEAIEQVCYFKSKSSKAKKTPKQEREAYYKDDTCKTVCKTFMRLSPEDKWEKNLKIADSLFSATFCLLVNRIEKQDSLADKIGIALCNPRQCFEECSTQEQIDALEAQTRSTTKYVFPKLKSSGGLKKTIGLSSQESSTCMKHCRDSTLTTASVHTVLPKL
ncbi:uncharacterized protein [Hemitrygon akajei]|uniref:uncharacterized protein n=1 Tax=Hemitrygon akajei TaxID=2704970 RepID=UPI003BF9F5D6